MACSLNAVSGQRSLMSTHSEFDINWAGKKEVQLYFRITLFFTNQAQCWTKRKQINGTKRKRFNIKVLPNGGRFWRNWGSFRKCYQHNESHRGGRGGEGLQNPLPKLSVDRTNYSGMMIKNKYKTCSNAGIVEVNQLHCCKRSKIAWTLRSSV